jgi:hypothetical protein
MMSHCFTLVMAVHCESLQLFSHTSSEGEVVEKNLSTNSSPLRLLQK